MTKVRVYELAKEYGMKGPAMAQLLKDLGFDKVKSHMAVLDDATELHARAILEAQGLQSSPAEAPEPKPTGLRKKTLPMPAAEPEPIEVETAAEETVAEVEPEPEPVEAPTGLLKKKSLPPPVPRSARKKLPGQDDGGDTAVETESADATPEVEAAPPAPEPVAEPAAPEPVTEAPAEPAPEPIVDPAAAAPESPPAPAPTPAPTEAPAAPTEAPAAPPAETPAEPAATEPASAAAAASADPAPAAAGGGEAPGAAAKEGKDVKKLLVPEARAKVVGRIDLPQEAISDAKRRSAPSTGRNPGGVDRNLRQAALRNTQSRSGMRTGARRGPGAGRRGPGGPGGRGRPEGRMRKQRGGQSGNLAPTVDPNKVVEIEPPITVKGLSEALGIKVTDLIAALTFKLGVAGKNINSFLTEEEVELVAIEVERKIKIVEQREAEEELLQSLVEAAEGETASERAPVLTFMGHVDHGKTTLLDTLRASDVTKGEAGGITQHIGAYKIRREDGFEFVVLDTPGHEAFSSMRARGASITDIVVLVVAADDGVMPQTEEAIAHAKDAKAPIIVAINKCDRPNANAMQVMQQLSVKGLQPEGWGGDVQCVEVSALTGQGIDDLIEQIALQAEILELDAKHDAAGEGVVIESKQSPEQGVVVSVLMTNGTLRLRDQVLCGESLSRVRGIVDDHGEQIKEAGPSTPVSLLGMTSLPTPGDRMFVVADKKKAKEVVDDRQHKARKMSLAERSAQTKVTLDNLSDTLDAAKIEELKIILKADVMGSLEPIKASLDKIGTDEVRVNIIHSALGGITESDVVLAEAGGAMILGFNTVADQAARLAAERAGVDLRYYSIIYELIDEMKLALEGKLKPDEVEEVTGHAEIKAVFRSSKIGNIAGLMVNDGLVTRNSKARLSRDGKVIYTGAVSSLRREKDDAKEVRGGYECGLTLKDFNDIKVGDELEFYDIKYVKRTLS